MSAPCARTTKHRKNGYEDIFRMLERMYPNAYRIFTLSDELEFDDNYFPPGTVLKDFQYDFDAPPSFQKMFDFVLVLNGFLEKNPRNIGVVCCSDGVVRSCMMLCCWLLATRKCKTPNEAIQLFSDRRLQSDLKAMREPSQLRYLNWFHSILQKYENQSSSTYNIAKIAAENMPKPDSKKKALSLESINFTTIPNFKLTGGCDPWFTIYQRGKKIYYSQPLKGLKGDEIVSFDCQNISVSGDIVIEFYHKNASKKMLGISFHTDFIKSTDLTFPRREVDLAWADTANKHFSPKFRVDIILRSVEEYKEMVANPTRSLQAKMEAYSKLLALNKANLTKTCVMCRDAVFPEDVSMATPRGHYHWECMRCEKCENPFQSDIVLIIDDKLVCEQCNVGGFFPKCATCQKLVKPEQLAGRSGSCVWHTDCFVCSDCGQSLLFSSDFQVLHEENAYCGNCAAKPENVNKPLIGNSAPKQEQKNFLAQLLAGEVDPRARKGHLSSVELGWLFDWILNDERENVVQASVKVLALAAYPTDNLPGLRKNILASGLVEYFIHYAGLGVIELHKEVDFDSIQISRELGKGASATVYEGQVDGKIMAVKVFDPDHIGFVYQDFLKEIAFMCLLEHENTVPCFGACSRSGQKLFILSELMQNGSLKDFLKKTPQSALENRKYIDIALQVAKGLNHLHKCGVIHRDLKPDNVMINSKGECKLIDFGISRVVEKDEDKNMTGFVGTPAYIAPELLAPPFKYSEKADVYSYAILCWELISGQRPFLDIKVFDIPVKVLDGVRPTIPENFQRSDFGKLVEFCWAADPRTRPNFSQIIEVLSRMASGRTLVLDASKCRVEGIPRKIKKGEKATVVVHAFDEIGLPRADCAPVFRVSVRSSDSASATPALPLEEDHEGRYFATYEFSSEGNFLLDVLCGRTPLAGSPFPVLVTESDSILAVRTQPQETPPVVPVELPPETIAEDFPPKPEPALPVQEPTPVREPSPPPQQPAPEQKIEPIPPTQPNTTDFTCNECQKAITKDYLVIQKLYYHPECFVCTFCRKPIDGPAAVKDGKLYCEADYKTAYYQRCFNCQEFISQGNVLSAFNRDFHPECFTCCICKCLLEDGVYYENEAMPNQLFCENHATMTEKDFQEVKLQRTLSEEKLNQTLAALEVNSASEQPETPPPPVHEDVAVMLHFGSAQVSLKIDPKSTVKSILDIACEELLIPSSQKARLGVFIQKEGKEIKLDPEELLLESFPEKIMVKQAFGLKKMKSQASKLRIDTQKLWSVYRVNSGSDLQQQSTSPTKKDLRKSGQLLGAARRLSQSQQM